MEKERDVRLVRFDLRLRVGADGDPFDNELHNAWAALPENTVIRNDWLRRRVLLGHILERDGLTELLAAISRIAPAASAPVADPAQAAPPRKPVTPAVADFLPPEPEAPPVPAAPPKPSARQQLGGLLPNIGPTENKPATPEPSERESAPATATTDRQKPAQTGDAATRKATTAAPATPPAQKSAQAAQPPGGAQTATEKPKPRPTLAGDQG